MSKTKHFQSKHWLRPVIKTLFLMKLACLLIMVTCLQLPARSFSQDKFTFDLKEVKMEKAFKEIEKKSDYRFVFSNNIVKGNKPINLIVKDASLTEVLNRLLENTGLTYSFLGDGKLIAISEAEQKNITITITGRVTDTEGNPLKGVSVYMKNKASIGTTTDGDGRFQITLPDDAKTLVFSSVDMELQEVNIAGKSQLDVVMKRSIVTQNEIVVVGYGTKKKKDLTTAISTVSSETLGKLSITRIDDALQGNASGVMVLNQNGQPGSVPMIRIRGTGTNTDPTPLYIVDGFPVSDIEYINPGDIASISVLKDAASAAIYGARGANGVILITTKTGKPGKTSITYNGYYGIQNAWRKVPELNATQYATIMNTGSFNANPVNPLPYPNPSSFGIGTNWQDDLFQKNVPVFSHEISASGGTDKTTYLASFSYFDQKGIIGGKNSDFSRYTVRLDLNQEVNKFLKIGTNLNYIHSGRAAIFDNGDQGGQVLGNAFNIDPITPLYETDPAKLADYNPNAVKNGSLTYGISPLATFPNPLAQLAIINGGNKIDKLLGNAFAEVNPFKGLTFRSTFGTDLEYGVSNSLTPIYFLTATSNQDYTSVGASFYRSYTWQLENVLSYSFHINKHSIEALAGQSAYKYFYQNLGGNRTDPSPIAPDMGYLDVATITPTTGANNGGADDRRLASYFGRITYGYDARYLFTAVLRRDGSSRFGRNNPYATFPSVSGAWVISREDFFNSKKISFLKLRASWGQNGNESLGSSFPWASLINTYGNGYTFLNNSGVETLVTGASLGTIPNPNLKWEASEQTDIGLDIELLKGKIALTTDYYIKATKNLLISPAIPDIVGYGAPVVNGGNVRNSGIELSINYKDHIGKDLFFNLSFNISHNVNKVTQINNASKSISGANYINLGSITRMAVGEPIAYFWGVKTNGIFQTQAQVDNYTYTNPETGVVSKIQPKAAPGDLIFIDANNDGKINDNDRVYLGDPNPKYSTGFTINLSYKAFDLSIFTIGMFGQKIFNGNYRFDKTVSNMPKTMLDYWTPDNPGAKYPRFISNDPNKNYSTVSDLLLEDGSFARIKNLQLGYTLPNAITTKALISSWRFFVAVDNAFTFTKYTGFDPEIGATSPLSMGIDRGVYPQARTFRFGVNLKL